MPGVWESPSYHENADCEYDDTEPDEWNEGLVGFTPTPVFDVSQTEGEPLSELDTAAHGEAGDLVERLLDAAADLGIAVSVVPVSEWSHGSAEGVCRYPDEELPEAEVKYRENDADLTSTLVHEYAHALLHDGEVDEVERVKGEVEAESTAYVAGRACGLDMSGSTFYLAAWAGEETDVIRDRLHRISQTAGRILDAHESGSE